MDDWIAETVRAFGADLGIDNLALDDEGGIELELELELRGEWKVSVS